MAAENVRDLEMSFHGDPLYQHAIKHGWLHTKTMGMRFSIRSQRMWGLIAQSVLYLCDSPSDIKAPRFVVPLCKDTQMTRDDEGSLGFALHYTPLDAKRVAVHLIASSSWAYKTWTSLLLESIMADTNAEI